uniref:Uncharacterized protein n=1 Tax=Arundo donax TaxID=35708 RepID=A0A0A9EV31_ARUDO
MRRIGSDWLCSNGGTFRSCGSSDHCARQIGHVTLPCRMLDAMHRKWKEWEHCAVKIAGLSALSTSLLVALRSSKHIAHRFLSGILVLVGSSSFCCSPSLLSAGAFTAEHDIVLDGAEGEAA